MRFSPSCTDKTAVRKHRHLLTFVLPSSLLAMAWLCNASLWSRCVTCQDVFVKPCRGNGNMEHRAAVCHLLCVKLGDSSTTTHGKLQQAFGDDAWSRAQTFRWHKTFSEGRTLVDDKQSCGRPSATRTHDNIWVRELFLIQSKINSQNDF